MGSEMCIRDSYNEKALSGLYASQPAIRGDIVNKWFEHAAGKRTILFAASIENSKAFVADFQARGVRAEHLDYTMKDERDAIIKRVRSGETTLVSNVTLLTEGVDVPELECAILARPTMSSALYLQMVGRIMRPKSDGSKARIHDHAGNCLRHGLPDADRDFTLEHSKPPRPPTLHTCPKCFAVFEGPICPHCNYLVGSEPESEKRNGPRYLRDNQEVPLEELEARSQKKPPKKDGKAYLEELVQIAIIKGYRGGWVVHRYLDKFPTAPKPWGAFRRVNAALGERG